MRILDNETVIAGIGGFGAISRAKKAHGAESRCCEIRLSDKKLDEVVTEANQGPLGTDLEQTGTVTQREHLDKELRQSTKMTKPKFVNHFVERVLVPGQHPKADPLVRRGRNLS